MRPKPFGLAYPPRAARIFTVYTGFIGVFVACRAFVSWYMWVFWPKVEPGTNFNVVLLVVQPLHHSFFFSWMACEFFVVMVFGDGMSRTVSFGLGCWFLVCFDENNVSRCGRVKEACRVIKN